MRKTTGGGGERYVPEMPDSGYSIQRLADERDVRGKIAYDRRGVSPSEVARDAAVRAAEQAALEEWRASKRERDERGAMLRACYEVGDPGPIIHDGDDDGIAPIPTEDFFTDVWPAVCRWLAFVSGVGLSLVGAIIGNAAITTAGGVLIAVSLAYFREGRRRSRRATSVSWEDDQLAKLRERYATGAISVETLEHCTGQVLRGEPMTTLDGRPASWESPFPRIKMERTWK